MMKSVWIAGCSSYETTGVMHLLKACGISAGLFRSGVRFRNGDTLILCLSSTHLTGWWRYLRLIQWLERRHDIRFIVLCPARIFSVKMPGGKNVIWSDGEASQASVSAHLCSALNAGMINDTHDTGEDIDAFWAYSLMCLRETPSAEPGAGLIRKAYRRRLALLQRLNLRSVHFLRIFMSGMAMRDTASGDVRQRR